MRLIDADALLKKFCVNSEGRRIPEVDCDNHEITVSIKDIKKFIREQPTVYNLDKVVEELEEKHRIKNNKCIDIVHTHGHTLEYEFYNGMSEAFCEAIDIVKRGGVE